MRGPHSARLRLAALFACSCGRRLAALLQPDAEQRDREADVRAAQGGFVAQRRVEPGEIPVQTTEGARPMKFDVRAYAYRDDVLLLGARVYQGQVTNLRTPGGGFSAICVIRS